ncbi:exodeoxyribonuclease III [Caldimonas tepidiphila]|uniref:exodeoxyribonuclease III n=1 Tax=Caldimonas tepidiphila TaxID=2315841 RepID=UPI000E5B6D93|nr:exodeoxyribonuclease III [Caldimonas tepidiphila]
MRIISLNANGIRSAATKGWPAWLEQQRADFCCLQELKCQAPDVIGRFEQVAGLRGHFHHAEKKGYSGVGVYSRHEPSDVRVGFGCAEFDAEGRYVEARFDTPSRRFSVISCYFPSGSSSEERQQAKFRFLAEFMPQLEHLKAGREFVLCGDINIAHQALDLKNWKGNLKNSGFLPEERDWFTRMLGLGLVDVHRTLRPADGGEAYTWWSNRGQAWAKNVGWRIDYQIATPAVAATAHAVAVYKDQRFSDHAPLTIDYDYPM